MPEPVQLTIDGDTEPLQAAIACPSCGRIVHPDSPHAINGVGCRTVPLLFTAPQTMRGQLAMPTDRAPGPADQTGKLVGPCDHPDYALTEDLPYGDGRTYCTLCGAKAG